MLEQVVGWQWFFVVDVDYCVGQLVVFQCCYQVGVYYCDIMFGIDKQCCGFELGEQCMVVDVVGIGGVGQQVDQVVGCFYQVIEVVE